MWPLKTVLIATDFSELSNDAHEAACAVARQHHARLIVLHVAEKPVVSYIEKASELSSEELQHKLWDTLRWPRDQETDLTVDHRIVEGEPVKEIVRVAQDNHADLIVMGASGRTGLLRWFTGSVTDEVCRGAPCSVLLVKPRVAREAETESTRRETWAEQVSDERREPLTPEPALEDRPAIEPRTPIPGPAPVPGAMPVPSGSSAAEPMPSRAPGPTSLERPNEPASERGERPAREAPFQPAKLP